MNRTFGVPALAGPGRLKAGLRTDQTIQTGSWSQCAAARPRRLSMNRNSQTRITNDEIRRNTEILMTKKPLHTNEPFDIRVSDFFRHSSFVIRHSTTGLYSQCAVARPTGLSINSPSDFDDGASDSGAHLRKPVFVSPLS